MIDKDYYLFGEIDTKTAKECIEWINDQQHMNSTDKLQIYINSCGGEVTSGLAIADAIMTSKIPITTICIGNASSVAFLIFVSGKTKKCYPHSLLMYHAIQHGFDDTPVPFIKSELENDERLQAMIDDIILQHTRLSQFFLDSVKMSGNNRYFDANEALKLGCVDEVIGG